MLRTVVAALCALHCIACTAKLPDGRYEGNFRRSGTHTNELMPVHIYIKREGNFALHAKVFDKFDRSLITIELELKNGSQLELSIPEIRAKPFTLFQYATPSSPDPAYCFEARDTPFVNLCFNEYQFMLRIDGDERGPSMSLTGSLFAGINEPNQAELEPPRSFLLTQAIERSYERNFESLAAIEHVMQAKNAALAAWLNLLPHLTSNLIWNVDFGVVSAIATIQALAPFLLPSYWMQAKASDIEVKIKHDALLLVRANLALSVEQLAYAAERDGKLIVAHNQLISELTAFRESFDLRLLSYRDLIDNILQDLKEIQKFIDELARGRLDIEAVLKEDYFSLAAALGLRNPEGVLAIVLDKEEELIGKSTALDAEHLAKCASDRSFEVDQIEYLLRIARLKRAELFLTWIDPAGDQKLCLGFNLIGSSRVAMSQAEELKAKKKHMKDAVYLDAYRTAQAYNRALEVNSKSAEHNSFESLRKFREKLAQARLYGRINVAAIKNTAGEYLRQTIEYQSNLANFRIARAKKDRLLLSGYYDRLFFKLPTASMPVQRDSAAKPFRGSKKPILGIGRDNTTAH
jgi:hypothetical protein